MIRSKLGVPGNAEKEYTKKIINRLLIDGNLYRQEQRLNVKLSQFVSELYQHIPTGQESLSNLFVLQILKCPHKSLKLCRFIRKCRWQRAAGDQDYVRSAASGSRQYITAADSSQNKHFSQKKNYRQPESPNSSENSKGQPMPHIRNFTLQATASGADHSCIFCGKDHLSHKCKQPLTLEERHKLVMEKRRTLGAWVEITTEIGTAIINSIARFAATRKYFSKTLTGGQTSIPL